MRKAKITVTSLLVLSLFLGTAVLGLAAPKQKKARLFSDVDQAAWALPDVAKMKAIRVIKGYDDGTFRPNDSIKRQDAVLMAIRLVGLEEEAEEASDIELPFKDAGKIADYAENAVALAYDHGWLDPLFPEAEGEQFQPHKSASRLWVTVMLVNALTDEDAEIDLDDVSLDFNDSDEVEEGLVWYVIKAVELGLIKGFDDGTLQPNKPVTRAQMAALLSRTDDNMMLFECKHQHRNRGFDEIEGTVISTVYDQITVETEDQETVTVKFATDVSIFIEEDEATWEDIKPGDKVEIKVDEDGLAVFVKVEREEDEDEEEIEYKAIVAAIALPSGETDGSIRIETEDGIKEFTLPSDVEVKDELELADVEVGMKVEIEVLHDTVIKIEVEDLDEHDDGEEGKVEKQSGKVASITLPGPDTEGSITIYLGNSKNTKTFRITAEVKVEGADDLTAIKEGVKVEIKLSGGNVIEIEVED